MNHFDNPSGTEKLPLDQAARLFNILGDYLARRDLPQLDAESLKETCGTEQADLLILFGGSILHGCLAAGEAFSQGIAKRLMVVGGVGHTTQALRDKMNIYFPAVETRGAAEADMIASLLCARFHINREEVLIERESKNCGENVAFALRVLDEKHIRPKTVLAMQDSSMQQRMDATFKKLWTGRDAAFISYASYRAQVAARGGQLVFVQPVPLGMWGMEHYITLLMGEIPRLCDTPEGYGPQGKNYIEHVDVPPEVLEAFARLKTRFGTLVRGPWQGGAASLFSNNQQGN